MGLLLIKPAELLLLYTGADKAIDGVYIWAFQSQPQGKREGFCEFHCL